MSEWSYPSTGSCDIPGSSIFCNGAISGKWWKGEFQDFEPAYALFEFHKDGTIRREIIEYDKP